MKIFHTALSVAARERYATRVRLPMRFRGRKSSPNREIDRDRAPASASAATIISIVTLTSCAERRDRAVDNNKNDARYLFAGNVTRRRHTFLAADQATTTTMTTTTMLDSAPRGRRFIHHASSDRAHAVYGRVSREPRPWNASKSRLARPLPKRAIHRPLAEIFADVRTHAAVLAGSPAAIARVHVVVAARANEHSDIFPSPSPLPPFPRGPGEITSAICNKKYATDRDARARARAGVS